MDIIKAEIERKKKQLAKANVVVRFLESISPFLEFWNDLLSEKRFH